MPSPEHERIVDTLSAMVRAPGLSFEQRQAGFQEAAASLFPSLASDVAYEAVDAGGVPAEWVRATGAREDRVVFYLHGGGYTQGSPATHRELASRISRSAAARVLVIDYRLAPANPFPAPVEDSLKAYRWLLAQGVAASRIAFAGDSAGGGLAVASLFCLRDAGEPSPACAVALSPWFDLEGTGASAIADQDPIVLRQHMLDVGQVYLAGGDPHHPLAAPVHGDFAGLPPLLIQVGTRDLLLDDSRRAAAKAEAAGTPTELEVWDGLIHVWHIWGDGVPEARQALDRIGGFIAGHIPSPARP